MNGRTSRRWHGARKTDNNQVMRSIGTFATLSQCGYSTAGTRLTDVSGNRDNKIASHLPVTNFTRRTHRSHERKGHDSRVEWLLDQRIALPRARRVRGSSTDIDLLSPSDDDGRRKGALPELYSSGRSAAVSLDLFLFGNVSCYDNKLTLRIGHGPSQPHSRCQPVPNRISAKRPSLESQIAALTSPRERRILHLLHRFCFNPRNVRE